MTDREAKFGIGEVVGHLRFEYRGVIVVVDACYQGSEEWYHEVARSRPPRDRPWYHVLVHQAKHSTYVAERNLEPDGTGEPIVHPVLDHFFDKLRDGVYVSHRASH